MKKFNFQVSSKPSKPNKKKSKTNVINNPSIPVKSGIVEIMPYDINPTLGVNIDNKLYPLSEDDVSIKGKKECFVPDKHGENGFALYVACEHHIIDKPWHFAIKPGSKISVKIINGIAIKV